MSLAQWIQSAWNRQAPWLLVLRPLSLLYRAMFLLNKSLYQLGIKKSYQAPIPVMVIGNITVGGSGKTPLLIQLVKYLQRKQVRVGVISRGYGGLGPFPALVLSTATAQRVGDEPALIVQSTQVPMAVGPNRQQAIELLLSHHPLDLIISDDGLQHWALQRQIEWIVLDQNRGLGNEQLLPEGYLREPKSRLTTGTVVEHAANPASKLHMHLQTGQPYALSGQHSFNPHQAFHAVVGIGYPERFYQTLKGIGVRDFQVHEFADHHDYQLADLQFADDLPIITTAKDAVKILPLLQQHPEVLPEVWVVPVEAVLSDECYQVLRQQLARCGIQISEES